MVNLLEVSLSLNKNNVADQGDGARGNFEKRLQRFGNMDFIRRKTVY